MQKKAIFALPNIIIDESIILENIKLKHVNKLDCDNYFQYNLNNLTTINMDNFKACDLYSKKIHEFFLDIITKLKFAYFFKHISSGHGYPGFIAEEAFDLFVLLEKNQDTSFEHKISVTNGLTTFLMSMDEYYKYKNILGNITPLKIHKKSLQYFYFFNNYNDNKKLLLMDLYNKCRKISTLDDNFNRIIFARTSIEVLIKDIPKLNLKNYVTEFIEKSKELIETSIKKHDILYSCYTKLKLDTIKNTLNEYMKKLAEERHNILHDGESSINTPLEVYLVWFPLFFVVSYNNIDKEIEFDLSLRILLFLNLLSINPELWNKIDYRKPSKKTCLYAYDECVNSIPNLIKNENIKYLEAYIKGFQKCIEEQS